MVLGILVHNTHVTNTASPILPEVTDQEVNLLFHGLYRRRVVWDGCAFGPGRLCLRLLHGTTCKDEGFVVHVRGGDRFAGQIRIPFMEFSMTHCDEATPLTIEGVANRKVGIAAVTVMGDIWGLYAISQEEGILPYLRTQFRSVHCGRLHRQPYTRLGFTSQSTCALDWGPRYVLRQGLLCQKDAPLPQLRLSLLETGQVVRRPELLLDPERYNKVTCDDTVCRPFFRVLIWMVR